MEAEYTLTPGQQERWQKQIGALFVNSGSYLTLATSVARGTETSDKTVAGYIGEFRKGKYRGLRYFLGTPWRLRKLARAMTGTTAEDIQRLWTEVRRENQGGGDVFFLAGFEDWGPVELERGLVPPPLMRKGQYYDLVEHRAEILGRLSDGLSVAARPSSGVTCLQISCILLHTSSFSNIVVSLSLWSWQQSCPSPYIPGWNSFPTCSRHGSRRSLLLRPVDPLSVSRSLN